MAVLLVVLVLAVLMVSGAELVRLTCRKQLAVPAQFARVPSLSPAEAD